MTSRPGHTYKHVEMSRQQELIDRRRREIEQRRQAAAGGGGGGPQAGTSSTAAETGAGGGGPSGSLSATSSARRMFEAHKQRWVETISGDWTQQQALEYIGVKNLFVFARVFSLIVISSC